MTWALPFPTLPFDPDAPCIEIEDHGSIDSLSYHPSYRGRSATVRSLTPTRDNTKELDYMAVGQYQNNGSGRLFRNRSILPIELVTKAERHISAPENVRDWLPTGVYSYNGNLFYRDTFDNVQWVGQRAAKSEHDNTLTGSLPGTHLIGTIPGVESVAKLHTMPDLREDITDLAGVWKLLDPTVQEWIEQQDYAHPLNMLARYAGDYPQVLGLPVGLPLAKIMGVSPLGTFRNLSIPSAASQRLDIHRAEVNVEDGNITLHRTPQDIIRGRKTTMRLGKALRHLFPEHNDEWVKNQSARILGELTPPELTIGFDKAEFDEAYTNGPSSCMTYSQEDYLGLAHLYDDTRPTDALINGDIGVAYLSANGRVTARTLIVESQKAYVRIYTADYSSPRNNGEVLEKMLQDEGYSEDRRALIGQVLKYDTIDPDDCEGEDEDGENVRDALGLYCLERARFLNNLEPDLTTEHIRRLREAADLELVITPYVDWDNPVLVKTQDGELEVSAEVDLIGYNIGNYIYRLETLAGFQSRHGGQKIGRAYYQAGCAAMYDAVAMWEVIQEIRAERQAEREAAQAEHEAAQETLDLETPTPPQAPLLHFPLIALPDEVLDDDFDTRLASFNAAVPEQPVHHRAARADSPWPKLLMWCGIYHNCIATDSEAEMLFQGEAIKVPIPGVGLTWVPEDEVFEAENGTTLVSGHEWRWHYDVTEDGDWYPEDEVIRTVDGTKHHRDDVRQLHCGDWAHEDDCRYSERDDCYYHEDDVVLDMNGDYIRDTEARRLPNGDYIHVDDLEEVA